MNQNQKILLTILIVLLNLLFLLVFLALGFFLFFQQSDSYDQVQAAAEELGMEAVRVKFDGGFDTRPEDNGEPVVLISGAFEIHDGVYQDVSMMLDEIPSEGVPQFVQKKATDVLMMSVFAEYGISSNRFEEVMTYYSSSNSMRASWPTRAPEVYALTSDGEVQFFEIIDGGAGFNSEPEVSVPGFSENDYSIELHYGYDFESNGSVKAVEILE